MGEVYLCHDREGNTRYALKTFQARYLRHPGLPEAFAAEVAVWVRLEKHLNVVQCFFKELPPIDCSPSLPASIR